MILSTNKTKNSLLNSISSLSLTFYNSIFNLVIVRLLIEKYGSDVNGLNSTATQFVNVLFIIEGGFSIAACVSLFKPLSFGLIEQINTILYVTKNQLKKISILIFSIGFITAFILALIVKTSLPYYICLFTFLFLLISTSFRIYYVAKYSILIQANQKEYLINFTTLIFQIISSIILYFLILSHVHVLYLRAVIMISAICSGLFLSIIFKKNYSNLSFNSCSSRYKCDEIIKGTKDIFVQKFVGLVYFSAPILSITIFVNTSTASIYAVYATVFSLLRSIENSIINSPRMSLGRLISESGIHSSKTINVFNEYEFCAIFSISSMLSVAIILIMPFIQIYSKSFDISYLNWNYAILLSLICFVECIHIPSGNLINMSGHFKEGKIIQIIAGFLLFSLLIISGIFYGINEILLSILITAFVLSVLEIGFVRIRLIYGLLPFFRVLITNIFSVLLMIFLEFHFGINNIHFTLASIFVMALVLVVINSSFNLIISFIFNRNMTMSIIKRLVSLIH